MGHRILLADDSLTIQKVVELTFSETDYELMAVGSGDRAVEALEEFRPDIVLADVVMPGLTGYEVCEAVKKRPDGAAIPVILLTGTFEPFDRARAERVGCDSIVTKPFDSHALSSLVEQLIAKGAEIRAALSVPPPPLPPVPLLAPPAPIQDLSADTVAFRPLTAFEPPPVSEDVFGTSVPKEPALPVEEVPAHPSSVDEDTHPLLLIAPPRPAEKEPAPATASGLTDAEVERIARRVIEMFGEKILLNVAWDVVPEMAERVVRERLAEIEKG